MPTPLGSRLAAMPPAAKDIVLRATTTWLKSSEVIDLLQNWQDYGLPVGREAPNCPDSGSLFLFNRKVVRFFRKDGHAWRKKDDGKTVRETHEKLKINNKDVLNCYYAHSERNLQRRCYWLLPPAGKGDTADASGGDIVLVHYLAQPVAARLPSFIRASEGGGMTRAESLPAELPSEGATVTTGLRARPALPRAAAEPRSASSCSSAANSGSMLQQAAHFKSSPFAAFGAEESGASPCRGRQLDRRKRTLSSLQSAPVLLPTTLLTPGYVGKTCFPWSPLQDSRQSSQSLDLGCEPLSLHASRGSGRGLPPLQSGVRGSRSSPLAQEFAIERVASTEVTETYDLFPSFGTVRAALEPGQTVPETPRSPGPPPGRGRIGGAAEAAPFAQLGRSTMPISSPFQALAQSNPIARGWPIGRAGVRRHQSAGTLGLMLPSVSHDCLASATASDFGRMDLERRSSKRQCSGLTSQRLSAPASSPDVLEQLLSGAFSPSLLSEAACTERAATLPPFLSRPDPGAWQNPSSQAECPVFAGPWPEVPCAAAGTPHLAGATAPLMQFGHEPSLLHILPAAALPEPPLVGRPFRSDMQQPILPQQQQQAMYPLLPLPDIPPILLVDDQGVPLNELG